MITTPPPSNLSISTVVNAQQLSSEITSLTQNDVTDSFKAPLLKHYIDQIIAKNEKVAFVHGSKAMPKW